MGFRNSKVRNSSVPHQPGGTPLWNVSWRILLSHAEFEFTVIRSKVHRMKMAAQTQSGTRFAEFQARLLVGNRERWLATPTIVLLRTSIF
jgi:hypothetical protein